MPVIPLVSLGNICLERNSQLECSLTVTLIIWNTRTYSRYSLWFFFHFLHQKLQHKYFDGVPRLWRLLSRILPTVCLFFCWEIPWDTAYNLTKKMWKITNNVQTVVKFFTKESGVAQQGFILFPKYFYYNVSFLWEITSL